MLAPRGGLLLRLVLLEDVPGHPAPSLSVLVGVVSGVLSVTSGLVLERSANHVVDDILLLVRHSVIDFLDGRTVGMLHRLVLVILAVVLTLDIRLKIELKTGVDDGLVLQLDGLAVRVLDREVVDDGTRIGASHHEADLTDHAVDDVGRLLHELVCEDGQRRDVAVHHQRLGVLSRVGVVEVTVGVDAIRSILQHRMTENVGGLVVAMLPDQRHGHLVLVLEGIRHDGPTVGALETGLSGPTAEVGLPVGVHQAATHDQVVT